MLEIDGGVDDGDRDVGAIGKRVGLRQAKLCLRIFRGVAFSRACALALEGVAEVRLKRANAAILRELPARGFQRLAAGNAKQADGDPDQLKIAGFNPPQAVTPRQCVDLCFGQRSVDLGHDFIGDRARGERGV